MTRTEHLIAIVAEEKPNGRCAEIKRQILAGEYDFTRGAE